MVTGHVSIYINPVLPSLGSALKGLVSTTGCCSVYGNAGLAMLDTAVDDLVTVAGYLSIHDNDQLASLGATISNLVTVTGVHQFRRQPLFALLSVVRWFPGCASNRRLPTLGGAHGTDRSTILVITLDCAIVFFANDQGIREHDAAHHWCHRHDARRRRRDRGHHRHRHRELRPDLAGGGWFPKLVLVPGNVQITNNAVLSTMDALFQKLHM